MYAIIELQGHQYIVQEGDQIVVDNMDQKAKSKINIDSVLASFTPDGKDVKVWAPYLSTAQVQAQVVKNQKGDKTRVVKFKNKIRYHRVYGFRPAQTVLKIDKIVNG